MQRLVVLFLDGVGLGADDPLINPLAATPMPTLVGLLDGARPVAGVGRVVTPLASLVPTDACLGVPGRPQSATGQTALLTGCNAAQSIGEHYGPRPNAALRRLLEGDTLFSRTRALGKSVAFANAYPARYFEAVERGKRLHGAIPYAAQAAGVRLRTAADLTSGQALSVDLTNAAWRNGLGYPDVPLWTPAEAGRVMAGLAAHAHLVFFDNWAPDVAGHQGDLAAAQALLRDFDAFLTAVLDAVDLGETLVVITSDHGNIEDCTLRSHTLNPVPTVLMGAGHAAVAAEIDDLASVTPALLRWLDR